MKNYICSDNIHVCIYLHKNVAKLQKKNLKKIKAKKYYMPSSVSDSSGGWVKMEPDILGEFITLSFWYRKENSANFGQMLMSL